MPRRKVPRRAAPKITTVSILLSLLFLAVLGVFFATSIHKTKPHAAASGAAGMKALAQSLAECELELEKAVPGETRCQNQQLMTFTIMVSNIERRQNIAAKLTTALRRHELQILKKEQLKQPLGDVLVLTIGFQKQPLSQLIFKLQAPVATPSPLPTVAKVNEPVHSQPSLPPHEQQTSVPTTHAAQIALIIDDFGYDQSLFTEFADLDIPFAAAVLPHLPHSREIAAAAHAQHTTVILHLPMEPLKYPLIDPGPGALLSSMSEATLLAELRKDLDAMPYMAGVNNHMGSKLTSHRPSMAVVMNELKRRELFFVDSRTNSDTVAWDAAKEAGVRCAKRDVFLDDNPEQQAIAAMIERAAKMARIQGRAVVIGHAKHSTCQALRHGLQVFRDAHIELVSIERVLE